MTDGQVKYQNLMESQRHNLEMERLGAIEAAAKTRDAATREREASTKERDTRIKEDMKMYQEFETFAKGAEKAAQFMKIATGIGALFA